MPRTEMNPNIGKLVNHAEHELTLIMITHMPHRNSHPYYAERMSVICSSLASMIKTTQHLDRDILVWDNGSCRDMRDWLLDQKAIDYLIFSENLGITSAIYYALKLAPGRIVGISDDDVLFTNGWYEKELAILETYPRVATVCGYPVWEGFMHNDAAMEWIASDSGVRAEFIQYGDWPRKWEDYHVKAIGTDAWTYSQNMERIPGVKLSYQGVEALGCGGHCQFIGYKNIIQPFAKPLGMKLGKRYRYFDEIIDERGFLRLSTPERVTFHVGNKL